MRVWRAGCSSAPVWVSVGVCVCGRGWKPLSLCASVCAQKQAAKIGQDGPDLNLCATVNSA